MKYIKLFDENSDITYIRRGKKDETDVYLETQVFMPKKKIQNDILLNKIGIMSLSLMKTKRDLFIKRLRNKLWIKKETC